MKISKFLKKSQKSQNFSKSQKMLYLVVKVLFPTKKTATKCVAIQKNFKSQKMLFSVVKVLFPTKKTATKCVAIQKISKS